jgi:hypothetical protein
MAHRPHQESSIDAVEEALDVEIENPVVSPAALTHHANGLDRRFAGSIAIAVVVEDRIQPMLVYAGRYLAAKSALNGPVVIIDFGSPISCELSRLPSNESASTVTEPSSPPARNRAARLRSDRHQIPPITARSRQPDIQLMRRASPATMMEAREVSNPTARLCVADMRYDRFW